MGCKSLADAQAIMRTAAQNSGVIDLCRWLVSGKAQSWAEATRHLRGIEGLDAEGIRIQVANYISAVLLKTTQDKQAQRLLSLLEPFLESYNPSDKMAPLLHSVGLALNLDRGG